MILNVRLFAIARQVVGQPIIEVTLDDCSSVRDLRAAIAGSYPALAPYLSKILISVNSEYADDQVMLPANADVALIPPVSGGCDD